MSVTEIRTIAVLGCGLMGTGIALSFTASGYPVRIYGRSSARLGLALETLERDSHILAPPGQEAAFGRSARARVQTTTAMQDAVDDVDLVVEAIAENLEVKWRALPSWMPGGHRGRSRRAPRQLSCNPSRWCVQLCGRCHH